MAKNNQVVEEVEVNEQLTTADGATVEIVEKESLSKKALTFAKKNWKKAVITAAGVGLAFGGYVFGKRSKQSTGDLEFIDLDSVECDDADYSELIGTDDNDNN